MAEGTNEEWCKSEEVVWTDKKQRCTLCGRRLTPKDVEGRFGGSGLMWKLPPHKKKGYKIKRKKGHNKHGKIPQDTYNMGKRPKYQKDH